MHEKFLLVALMPLALLALEGRPRDVLVFRQTARLATFAVLPLIPGGADGVTKLLVVLAEELVLRSTFGGGGAFPGESVHCAIMAALVAPRRSGRSRWAGASSSCRSCSRASTAPSPSSR